MKYIIFALVFLLACESNTLPRIQEAPPQNPPPQIFAIFIGQSNLGESVRAELRTKDLYPSPNPNVIQWYRPLNGIYTKPTAAYKIDAYAEIGSYTPWEIGVNNSSPYIIEQVQRKKIGSQGTFGQSVYEQTGRKPYLFYGGFGGSSLDGAWNPNRTGQNLYDLITDHLLPQAIDNLPHSRFIPVIIWYQGETDALREDWAAQYGKLQSQLIDGVKACHKFLNDAEVLAIGIKVDNPKYDPKFIQMINASKRKYTYIDTKGLSTGSDGVHLTAQSQEELGYMIADKIL